MVLDVTKFDLAYLEMAAVWSKLSYCKRKQVGALIVKDRMIISDGYNGTPSGFENCCEDENGKTQWFVLHAEANAILKLAASTQSAKDATLYLTLSPCKECSKLILQAGIRKVVYIDEYSDEDGIEFLKNHGIELLRVPQDFLRQKTQKDDNLG
ncbi:dCMP deaminase family protein [Kaistella daneshvariae]|uniref:dCMP deaminase family protein n=1 Tax=Kaistella daneshvariae TaxID=2487074 RepID=A0ABM7C856_9FLAO|nr:dCMP deaminase family protein [Kaistella daneshvariae]AZI67164.1 dCMP deaminase family protein [Kaistella daneshvariae]